MIIWHVDIYNVTLRELLNSFCDVVNSYTFETGIKYDEGGNTQQTHGSIWHLRSWRVRLYDHRTVMYREGNFID